LSLSQWHGVEGVPNVVVIGVPDLKALERAKRRLETNAIDHFAWEEPDYDLGFTAIATAALKGREREPLAHYRLWNPFLIPGSSAKERPAASPAAGRSVVQVHPGEPVLSSMSARSSVR
jgi:hypothetical protein